MFQKQDTAVYDHNPACAPPNELPVNFSWFNVCLLLQGVQLRVRFYTPSGWAKEYIYPIT